MSIPRTGAPALSVTTAAAPGTAASDSITATAPITAAGGMVTLCNFLTNGT
jgi:hypothetical protein